MNSMAKNVLLIVEGDNDEVRFYKNLFRCCFQSADYHFCPYRSNIHVLAQELYNNYPCFEDDELDIRQVLISIEQDDRKKEILREKYTDVFLVFDFDPQHDHAHFDTVRRMLTYFCESTAQGQLFINYPMMQSYKHFAGLPDSDYKNLEVDVHEIKEYKKIVGQISSYTDLSKYDYKIFYSIAAHNLIKFNYLTNGVLQLPSCEEYLNFDYVKLYDLEKKMYLEEKKVSVINTCIFVLSNFAPTRFFTFLSKKRDELLF